MVRRYMESTVYPKYREWIRMSGYDQTGGSATDIRNLIQFALQILPGMFCPDEGLFCVERKADGTRIGTSNRYSMICLIGLQRARESGYESTVDLDSLFDRLCSLDVPTVADKGLLLWASAVLGKESCGIHQLLTGQLETEILELTGMDLGLALAGQVAYASLSGSQDAFRSAEKLSTVILANCVQADSHLFFHKCGPGYRKHLPNFATQIYLMYALSRYSIVAEDEEAGKVAAQCANTLCGLQRSDGGWPWIYHAKGRIVEDYEIYSVHQDGMMPMALLEVGSATSGIYLGALKRGLEWLWGDNDLGVNMVNSETEMIFRSIRRSRPFDRLMLGVNCTSSFIFGRSFFHASGFGLEVNSTCRPYHPGWILQAWCGREAVLSNCG